MLPCTYALTQAKIRRFLKDVSDAFLHPCNVTVSVSVIGPWNSAVCASNTPPHRSYSLSFLSCGDFLVGRLDFIQIASKT